MATGSGARQMLSDQPANRPVPGASVTTDKGLAGEGTEEFSARPGLGLDLIRPARKPVCRAVDADDVVSGG
jgi:hypothetical protein